MENCGTISAFNIVKVNHFQKLFGEYPLEKTRNSQPSLYKPITGDYIVK